LDFEISELDLKATVFDNLGVLFGSLLGEIAVFCASAHNFARSENKRSCFGIP